MKQITEDYVSFETAKLLKEKGFDGECRMTYREHDMQMIYYTPNPNDLLDFTTNRKKLEKHSKKQHCDYALCPTHQMGLKWLREVHKLHIKIGFLDKGINGETNYYYFAIDSIDGSKKDYCQSALDKGFNSYEKAVEAALNYVLKNLI